LRPPPFTFDDGPSEWTPLILDLLAEHEARAIFFVTGARVCGRFETVARAAMEGHTIGNHGYSHRRLTSLADDDVRQELAGVQGMIWSAIGSYPSLFRAPFFDTDERVNGIAAHFGLRHQGATLIPEDWCATDPEALAAVILSELRPGSVVSLHDGVPPDGGSELCTQDRLVTVEALRIVLEALAVRA
jgi:peptidoglycan/xylan/chitin deacetylase (PgdA/CDA1 family)